MKTLKEVSAYSYDSGFDGRPANVNANRKRATRIGENGFFAHNGLCIIPTLCNSTGQYGDARRGAVWQEGLLALPFLATKEPKTIRA